MCETFLGKWEQLSSFPRDLTMTKNNAKKFLWQLDKFCHGKNVVDKDKICMESF